MNKLIMLSITQIFYHLLYNAIKASPAGSEVQLRLSEEQFEAKNYLLFSTFDSGEGIAPEQLQRIFQRKYAAEKVAIKGIGDQGVGLSIVKSLSEKLGGRVWVESTEGQGSVFTVLLPIAEMDSKEESS